MNDVQGLIWQARNALADARALDGVSDALYERLTTAIDAARVAMSQAGRDVEAEELLRRPPAPANPDLLPVARTDWQGYPCYASARHLLNQGYACRSPEKGGWAIYKNEWGSYILYPGGEGPQETGDLEEVLDWIGGDQVAALTPQARKKLAEHDTRGEYESYRRVTEDVGACGVAGCTRPATWCRTYQNAIMPAPGFYYTCDEHKNGVN